MATVAEQYNRLVHDSIGWRGTYPLLIPIRVGDYFQMNDDGIPIGLGNAFNWPGWADAVTVDEEDIQSSETYYAGCGREAGVTAGAGVQVPGGLGAEATVSLSFGRSAGFVLAHDAGTRSHLRDVLAVQRSILASAKDGWWQEDWIFVTEVIASTSATLAIATEAGSRLELHANAAIPGALGGIGIANPQLGWTASSWKGSGYSSICKPGTPLYHCLKLRKGAFGKWRPELLEERESGDVFTDDPFESLPEAS